MRLWRKRVHTYQGLMTKPKQIELVPYASEGFALETVQGTDFQRIEHEKTEAERIIARIDAATLAFPFMGETRDIES